MMMREREVALRRANLWRDQSPPERSQERAVRDLLQVNHERRRALGVRLEELAQRERGSLTRVMDSRVEMRVKIRSVRPIRAASAGMKDPTARHQRPPFDPISMKGYAPRWAMNVNSAICLRKILFPL